MTLHLELAGVTASYAGARAIDDVSIAVPVGSVVALLGSNGAGKSTTLKAISGAIPIERGSIRLYGKRIDGLAPSRIARAGVTHIPEGRGIFGTLSVAENLAVASSRKSRDWTERVFDAFPDLANRRNQLASTLSGGQQQMLSLARAFSPDARMLMLDELSLGLAPILVDQLYTAIRVLAGEGRTILLVEQYVSRALELAELVYVLSGGKVVFAGEPSELQHAGGVAASYLGG